MKRFRMRYFTAATIVLLTCWVVVHRLFSRRYIFNDVVALPKDDILSSYSRPHSDGSIPKARCDNGLRATSSSFRSVESFVSCCRLSFVWSLEHGYIANNNNRVCVLFYPLLLSVHQLKVTVFSCLVFAGHGGAS